MAKNKDLMEEALFDKPESGAPKGKIYTPASNNDLKALGDLKELASIKIQDDRRKSDNELQQKVDEYNRTLAKKEKIFSSITIPDNMVIVKLARLPHIDPKTGFVIPRILHEPAKSGADTKGTPVTNTYPYYDFGFIVKSNSTWVEENRYAQLSYDAIMQQFQREEGKWKYYMPNEFTFWNKRKNERTLDTLDCYVLIRDYQVEVIFDKDYKPKYD